MARWQARRQEAIDAVISGLEGNWLATDNPPPGPQAGDLARLLHKLAGTAAMFGEAALGEAAAALERALSEGADATTRTALAQALLAHGGVIAEQGSARRAGR
jgi:HPt (histidine-containing phosphotransfer) domain-containing protein